MALHAGGWTDVAVIPYSCYLKAILTVPPTWCGETWCLNNVHGANSLQTDSLSPRIFLARHSPLHSTTEDPSTEGNQCIHSPSNPEVSVMNSTTRHSLKVTWKLCSSRFSSLWHRMKTWKALLAAAVTHTHTHSILKHKSSPPSAVQERHGTALAAGSLPYLRGDVGSFSYVNSLDAAVN